MKRQGISYSYQNGSMSHYCLKKIEGSCHIDKDCTHLIGVYCKVYCPYYWGIKDNYVVCTHPDLKDDENTEETQEIRSEIYRDIYDRALCALDY